MSLWVKGDGSGNILGVSVRDQNGFDYDLTAAILDFSTVRQFVIALPANVTRINGFYLLRVNDDVRQGDVGIDHVMLTYGGAFIDDTPPAVAPFSIDDTSFDSHVVITTAVSDDLAPSIGEKDLTVTVNGIPVDYLYDAATGALAFSMDKPVEPGLHMLTVEAADPSGNRTRRTMEYEPLRPDAPVYDDINGNWARRYIQFLGERDIVAADGVFGMLYYRPDSNLTRADMALYVARLLRVDLNRYNNYALPYADAPLIPTNIRREVAAMYDMGIITGAVRNGLLYFDPDNSITRGDFMTILGRTMPKGYTGAALPYADAHTVPSYMRDHIAVLTALGIVAGNTQNQVLPFATITRAEAAKILCWMY
jgi:hypothetical protein